MVTEQLKGFIHFIRTQGVAGFAIGFILGKAVSDLVGSLVNDIINPIVGIFLRNLGDLTELTFQMAGATISYGKFLSLLINFFIIASVVYWGIRKLAIIDQPKTPLPSTASK